MAKNEVVIRFLGDDSKLKNVIKDVEHQTGGMATKVSGGFSKLGAVATAGFAAAGVAAVAFGKNAVGAASDLAETQSKVNTVFGDMAGSVSQYAKAAHAIGLSDNAALNALGTFGNMFDQLGIGTKQSAAMSKQMVTLAADLGSFHNADITEVIEAQSSAFRGEYDALQRFIPTINAAAVEQKALAMTGKASTKELTLQEKALAVQKLMMEGAGKAAGDFERTSGSLANQQRTLGAQMADLSAKVGTALIPIMTKLTEIGLGVVDFLSKLSPEAQIAIGVVIGLAGAAFLIVKAVQAWTAAQAALNIVLAMNPIGLVVLGIAALIAALILAWNHSETFRNVVTGVFNAVKNTVSTAVDVIKGVLGGLSNVLGAVWDPLRSAAKAVFNAVAKLWNNTVGRLSFNVPSWVPVIGGKGWDVPNIPVMHDGGVFHAPPGQREGLALLEDGERVLSRRDSAGMGGGLTVNYYGTVFATKREMEDALADLLDSFFGRGGSLSNGRGGTLQPA